MPNLTSNSVIILDPGHGGTEIHGKSTPLGVRFSSTLNEKDINLNIARRVLSNLNDRQVIMTRTGDQNLSLHQRASLAQEYNNPVSFISIHCRGSNTQPAPETWIHTNAINGSSRLAEHIQNEFSAAGRGKRAVQRGQLAVLDPTTLGNNVAACLIESEINTTNGNLQNLQSSSVLETISRAIAGGIHQYLSSYTGGCYGATYTIEVGSPNWTRRARESLNGMNRGDILVFSYNTELARQFIENLIREAFRRGIILDPNLERITSSLREAVNSARRRLGDIGRRLLNRIIGSEDESQALELTTLSVVLILGALAIIIGVPCLFGYLNNREAADLARDLEGSTTIQDVEFEPIPGISITYDHRDPIGTLQIRIVGLGGARVRLQRS